MKYQLILESERKVALQDIRSSALIHGVDATEVTLENQTHIPRNEILYVLQDMDMEGLYDDMYGEDSYHNLSDEAKESLKYHVKNNLGYGLGESWHEYMEVSVDLAQDSLRKEGLVK